MSCPATDSTPLHPRSRARDGYARHRAANASRIAGEQETSRHGPRQDPEQRRLARGRQHGGPPAPEGTGPTFYGHPDGWGSGIATVLMTETLRRLHDDGFTRVHLWTLRDTPRSRRFCTRSGFAESGAERTYDFGDGNALDQIEYERTC
ncbi:GNAT family N-acetyltransferase [Streptomyces angustmyceticus]|nr:GNAT family N-acetyltransferase [Streptomyces angustmyceticus]UAL65217.1 GNAT family N-acetyltransferase [Streptomyces angustmyceticus]